MMKLSQKEAQAVVNELKFRSGLVTAVTRDSKTKDILMLAVMDKRAVLETLTTGLMHYWSRSRRTLWLKGEISRHYQRVQDVYVDCDGDALIFDVEQVGEACHHGYRSCFYRKVKRGKLAHVMKKTFEPKKVYKR